MRIRICFCGCASCEDAQKTRFNADSIRIQRNVWTGIMSLYNITSSIDMAYSIICSFALVHCTL